jgi:hypothetical protein
MDTKDAERVAAPPTPLIGQLAFNNLGTPTHRSRSGNYLHNWFRYHIYPEEQTKNGLLSRIDRPLAVVTNEVLEDRRRVTRSKTCRMPLAGSGRE